MKTSLYIIAVFAIFLFSCSSKKTATELFSEAQKFTQEKNIPDAVSTYEKIIHEYPEDKVIAPQAIANLAAIYQYKMVKNVAEKESLQKAIKLFRSIYEDYPQSEQAPMGLFMSGFLQANELKDFNSATATYNLFLEKYPNHELAKSVKEELDNMGLSPEEILLKHLAKSEKK